jgi:ribosomal protein L32
MRHTSAHSKNRRSHHHVEKPALSVDSTGAPHLRHRVSPTTGIYKGRKVIDVKVKATKKEKAEADLK